GGPRAGLPPAPGVRAVVVGCCFVLAARAVYRGRGHERATEVLKGLKPGQEYAASNSFVLKAELGKGSAEHE
ncbi:efflux transporter periplasmic adaptor subunit, partial [Burkholderia contaminans]|nr:efflux transporter periplasmic adaptor subunit [Burkholderia contaminans]